MIGIVKQLRCNKDGKLHWYAVTPLTAKRINRDYPEPKDRLVSGIVYDVIMEITIGIDQLIEDKEIILN